MSMAMEMGSTAGSTTFRSLNPVTGKVVAEHPVHDEKAVRAAVEAARAAAVWWGALSFRERRIRLLNAKSTLTRNLARLAELTHQETGKPVADATLEIAGAIMHLDWAARRARKILGPRGVFPGLTAINHKCTLEYQPLGVVGVIGPWNYPVFTPMGSIAYALAAGNAVVFKPSEYTPGVGVLIAELFAEAIPEHPVLQVVTGLGHTGAALASSGVDKIAFTGSTATAKKVMATCAKTLTPIVAECGGKDAFIVAEDADLDMAASAAVWGAMSNAGQTCVGVERVYVVEGVYDAFVRKVTEKAKALRPGAGPEAAYGPITMPRQLDIIERHIDDALDSGGTAIVGGPESVRRPYVDPVVLVDVPDGSAAIREETFGPTVTITKVNDLDEAVTKANDTSYGLAGAVFAGNASRALQISRRLRTGMISINAVIAFAMIPSLPFGGVGESGFGRIHGADGLREFARAKAITRQRFSPPIELTSFARGDKDMRRLIKLITRMHGRRYK